MIILDPKQLAQHLDKWQEIGRISKGFDTTGGVVPLLLLGRADKHETNGEPEEPARLVVDYGAVLLLRGAVERILSLQIDVLAAVQIQRLVAGNLAMYAACGKVGRADGHASGRSWRS